jgi:hypothetical protein
MDAGRSEFGFSRSGEAGRCFQLYSYVQGMQLPVVWGDPLDRGSLVHTGRAHFKELIRRDQQGLDDGDLYPPTDAVLAHAELMAEHGRAPRSDIVRKSVDAVRQYVDLQALQPQNPVVAVEQPYRVLLSRHKSMGSGQVRVQTEKAVKLQLKALGLKLERDPRPAMHFVFYVKGWTLELWKDHQITPFYALYTQRVDLVEYVKEPGYSKPILTFDDLKTSNRHNVRAARDAYGMSGQFWGYTGLAKAYYPKLAAAGRIQTQLTMILMPKKPGGPATFPEPQALPPAPWRERLHWWNIWQTYARIMQLVRDKVDPWQWPAVGHEMGCDTKYGMCQAIDLCRYGPEGLAKWQMIAAMRGA